MEDCPLVMIEWEDSARPVPEWRWLADYRTVNAVRCTLVGWMTHDGDEVKALAPNLGEIGSSETMQASGVIRIPTRCVVRVIHLAEVKDDVIFSSLSPLVEGACLAGDFGFGGGVGFGGGAAFGGAVSISIPLRLSAFIQPTARLAPTS